MNCMRCGRNIEADQVFCADCLETMKKHPVNPGTAIRIPRRPDPQLKRMMRRKTVSEEDQIRILKKRLKIMVWSFIVVSALLIGVLAFGIVHMSQAHDVLLPGQNYSSATGN